MFEVGKPVRLKQSEVKVELRFSAKGWYRRNRIKRAWSNLQPPCHDAQVMGPTGCPPNCSGYKVRRIKHRAQL